MLQINFKTTAQFVCGILLPNLLYSAAFAMDISNTQLTPSSELKNTVKKPANDRKNLLFPPEFKQQIDSPITEKINKVNNEYLNTLEETSAFNGLYLTGGYARNINNDLDEYSYGLEWALYDNGGYAAERQLNKRKLESHLQFLQQLRQTYRQHKNAQINFSHQIESRLDLYITELQSKIILPQLLRAKQRLKKGFMTQVEYREWELRASNVRTKKDYLKNSFFVNVDNELFELLNHIESKKIKNFNKLLAAAEQNSITIKLQKLFSSRSKFLPTWKDNLSLSFYLEQRDRQISSSEKLVGMRLRLPLGANSNRDKLIHLDQKIYQDKLVKIKIQIKQKLQVLVNKFHFLQQRIEYLSQKNSLLLHKINTLRIQKSAGLPSLDYTPEKDIPLYRLQHIDLLNNVLRTRLKLYVTIVEIEELVVPKKLMDLFE